MDNTPVGFEVDYIHVGSGSGCGDAIALRYGNLFGVRNEQTVIVIDGGTLDSGEDLVKLILQEYHTDKVDYVISTHQDADHASGLKVILQKLSVDYLLMHIPWEHEAEINALFEKEFTDKELEKRLQKSIDNIRDLEEIAIEKGIAIMEPFTGTKTSSGSFHVLGPSKEFYENLIPHYRDTPDAKNPIESALDTILQRASDSVDFLLETLDPSTETLDDTGRFIPENESSVILLLTVAGKKILFTGDAGITALTYAADYADRIGVSLMDLHLFHVPHHGSKQNVGPTILNRIKAQKSQISAGLDAGPKHPAKKVVNALIRRGSIVFVTPGYTVCHSHNAPSRPLWSPIAALPFYSQVEV